MAKFDMKKATITVKDGGSNTLELNIGEGTLSFDEKRTIEYVKNRGLLDTTREGDDEPLDVKLDVIWEFLRTVSGGAAVTPYEAFHKVYAASAWVTTGGACEPYAVDLEILYTPSCGSVPVERILITQFRYESFNSDMKTGMLSVSGKANIKYPTITRV